MIPMCIGCQDEFEFALVCKDLFLVQQEITHIGERRHLFIMMVNNEGKVMVK